MDSTFERKLTTILSADAVGYSRMMGADEAATLATLRNYRAAIAALVEKYRGRIVGTAGDSLLAEFASVVRGVECAVAMQREIAERNAALPVERQMRFRVGVNLGDVMVEKDDLYGDGVNIAARLQALAEPGGILISGPVFDQVRDKLSLGFDFLGDKAVKNIATEVAVYRVQLGQPGMAREQLQPGAAPRIEQTGARVSEPATSTAGADKQAGDERRHRLYISALRYGAILAVLLAINILTWDGDFWFQWPALGLGLAFILHATVIFRKRKVVRRL
jgi:adenylate cyclase